MDNNTKSYGATQDVAIYDAIVHSVCDDGVYTYYSEAGVVVAEALRESLEEFAKVYLAFVEGREDDFKKEFKSYVEYIEEQVEQNVGENAL